MATKVTTGLLSDNAVTDAKLSATITATTQSASDNTTKVATTAYVSTAIANLADSAPSTLNTLNELAAALGDDANYATTTTNAIAAKLPLAGGTLTGTLTTPTLITGAYGGSGSAGDGFRLNSTDLYGQIDASDKIRLNVNGVSFINGGNVGIGTPSPAVPLDIVSNAGGNAVVIRARSADDYAFIIFKNNAGSAVAGQIYNHSGAIAFTTGTSATERMRIDSSGNVGIGTTAPQRALQVGTHGSGNGEIAIGSSTTGYGSILFGDSASGDALYRGYVQYNHSSEAMLFATAAQTRMTISSAGYQTNTNCRFQAKRSGSGNQDASVHVVVFDSEDFDIGGNYNTSDGNFTAPVTGHYFFYYHHMNHQSSGAYGTIYLDLNGSTYHYTHTVGGHPAGTTLQVTVPMTAGNTVRIRANQYYYNASYRHALFGGYLLG